MPFQSVDLTGQLVLALFGCRYLLFELAVHPNDFREVLFERRQPF